MTKIRRYTLKPAGPKNGYKVRYEDLLNREQLDVVMAPDGPILVIAGAGSGKTRTLTYRVSRLIEDGVDPSRILLLTFTNKAAREMLSRVEELVQTDTRRIWGGTFHATGNRILRRHAELLGFRPNFSILDNEDAKEMMEAAVSDSGVNTLEKRFPKGDILVDIHSFLVNTEGTLAGYLGENYPHFMMYTDEIRRVFDRYRDRKREANTMDFDDLLVQWKRLLVEHAEAAAALRTSFKHVLVDEYQDTNRIQAEIVDLMSADHRNVMVVGDDAQSIYSFRGASFENIITFPIRWPGCQAYKLETNYRSTPQILALANASIVNNRFQFPKQLIPAQPDGPEPAIVGVDDVFEQAQFVAQRILELRDEGQGLGDIAVLYRSHYQSLELQMELTRRNIPYEIRSGVRFFEQAHIKDVLSFLRVVINPRDELPWKRAMKLYPRVGARTAADIWAQLASRPHPLTSFIGGAASSANKATAKSLDLLRGTLRTLSSDGMKRSPSESIRLVVDDVYRDYAKVQFSNFQARLDDLEQLANYALRYDDVESFMADVALDTPLAGEDVAVAGPEDEKLVLSSVHQAKGLEWRTVFVIWLADGRFPSARALRVPGGIVRLPPKLPPLPADEAALVTIFESEGNPDDAGQREIIVPGEEEERRLFYVAVTRAQRELYLVHPVMARDRAQMDVLMEPSRFIRELPGNLFEMWVIGSQGV